MNTTRIAALGLAWILSIAAGAVAADEAQHRKEDATRHRQIAAAHTAAAACVKAGRPTDTCLAQLQKDCKGAAIGKHCGLKHQAHEESDPARHAALHERMSQVHTAAAACLESTRSYGECQTDLGKACGGIGVGKYCGMKHGH